MVTPNLSNLNTRQILQLQEQRRISSQQAAEEIRRRRAAEEFRRGRRDIERERISERREAQQAEARFLSSPRGRQLAEESFQRARAARPTTTTARVPRTRAQEIAQERLQEAREMQAAEARTLSTPAARAAALRSFERISGRRVPVTPPPTVTLPTRRVSQTQSKAIAAIREAVGVKPGRSFTVNQALKAGVKPNTLARAQVISFTQANELNQQLRAPERLKAASIPTLATALRQPNINANKLIAAGVERQKVQQAARIAVAQNRLEEFTAPTGQTNIVAAVRGRVPDQVLKNAGFSDEQISIAKQSSQSLERIAKLEDRRPKSKTGRVVQDILNETFTLTGRETETFNKDALQKEYQRRSQQLNKVYNEKLIELAKEGQGSRPITTRDQFIKQNLGTEEGYVNSVLRQQNNVKALTAKVKTTGAFTKEVGLASIPVYGTIRTWDEDPAWARAAGIAADLSFFIPIVGQVSAGVRTGKGLKTIARQTAIASLRAETLGQVEAIAHPIRTATRSVRPLVDALNPGRVPTSSVAFRDSTIRLPAEQEFFTKYGGHQAYPFALKVQPATVEGLGVATVGAPGAAVRTPGNKAAKEFLQGRDVATMRLVRGQSGKAFIGTDTAGNAISVNIPKAPFSKSVGAAAFHGTPDLRPYLPGIEIAGKEGGLFIAPTALTRFIRGSGTGATATLSPEIRSAIDKLPDKTKAAMGINRIADKPMPGALVIRDPAILNQLQGSGKFWSGTAEIELVVPNGVKLPPPSQFIKTRNDAGETVYLAIIGKPLNAAEIAKLKFVGAKETVGSIFTSTGSVIAKRFKTTDQKQARLLAQMSEESRRAEKLFVEASDAQKAGRVQEAKQLTDRAERLANDSASSLTRAQLRAGTTLSRAKIEPAALYTGRQDIERALTESGLGRPPSRATVEQNRRQNSTSTVLARPQGARAGVQVPARGRDGAARPTREGRARPATSTTPSRGRQPSRTAAPEAPTRRDRARAGVPSTETRARVTQPPSDRSRLQRVAAPRATTPPPKVHFQVPNKREQKKLKPGEFPRVVTFQQGLFDVTVDIDRGTRSFSRADSTGKNITPQSTFKIVTKDKSRPTAKTFRQGVVDVRVTPRSLSFAGRRQRNLLRGGRQRTI